MSPEKEMRNDFEEFADRLGLNIEYSKRPENEYRYHSAESAWACWKAACDNKLQKLKEMNIRKELEVSFVREATLQSDFDNLKKDNIIFFEKQTEIMNAVRKYGHIFTNSEILNMVENDSL